MDAKFVLLEKFELQEIILGSEDAVTLFGKALLWIEGAWRKGPLNLFLDYNTLQEWLIFEPKLLADNILNSVTAYLASDMGEPHIINCQKFADTSPVVLSAAFILHSPEYIEASDEEWLANMNTQESDEDVNYPESYNIKQAVLLDLVAMLNWNQELEKQFGKTLSPLKNIYLDFRKSEQLIALGYTQQQALSMLHLNYPYCEGLMEMVKVFERGE